MAYVLIVLLGMEVKMELIRFDAMGTAIQACHSVDEVKDIRDKAMALEAYAKQAMNTDAERKACEIRLRAERKAGSMLAEKERGAGPGRGKKNVQPEPSLYKQAKQDAGISDTQAKRWQKLANVKESEFESALKDKKMPSTTGIIKKANNNSNQMNPVSLWLWGRIRDFEREGISSHDIPDLYSEMTETMQADIKRILPDMVEFLNQLMEITDGQ